MGSPFYKSRLRKAIGIIYGDIHQYTRRKVYSHSLWYINSQHDFITGSSTRLAPGLKQKKRGTDLLSDPRYVMLASSGQGPSVTFVGLISTAKGPGL